MRIVSFFQPNIFPFISSTLPPDILELVINVLTIIFFISAGILYSYFGFYIFKTFIT
ncbi:unnamed protein product, partial [marine sediment metagenome]